MTGTQRIFEIASFEFDDLLAAALEITDAAFGSVQIVDPESGDLQIVAQRGFPVWWVEHWRRIPRRRGGFGAAMAAGGRVLIDDVETSPAIADPADRQSLLRLGIRAVQSTPMVGRTGEMLGMFSTHYRRPFRPDRRSLRLLDLLARQGAGEIERALTGAELQHNECRLSGLLLQGLTGVAETDAAGRFVYVNDRFCEIVGRDRATLMDGVRMQDLTLAQDLPENMALWQGLLAKGTPFQIEKRYLRPDGTTRWVHNSVSRIETPPGTPLRAAAICIDIEDRKRAEMQRHRSDMLFRGLFESVQTGIVLTDASGRFERCNHAYIDLVGYEEEELRWMDPATLVHPDDRDRNLAGIRSLLDGTCQSFEVEGRYIRKDGRVVWVSKRVSRIGDPSGAASLLVLLVSDITERRQAAEIGARAQRMEALGQLAGGIAHDFNNLMTIVSLSLDQLVSGPVDAAGRRAAQRAQHAIESGADLNRRLLAFARQRSLASEDVALNDRVAAMCAMLDRTLGDAYPIAFTPTAGLWATRADPGEIDSAIVNIVLNARDAMPAGGAIDISLANCPAGTTQAGPPDLPPGDHVRLEISDHGIGMAPEVLARAVEPFFTTKPAGKGSGLGLSTVYGFAGRSGGTLKITSGPGRGTMVRIYLPRAGADAAMSATTEPDAPPGAGERVLVVEDDATLREMAHAQLTDLGYAALAVPQAADAQEALRRDGSIRLVFSDVAMPGGMDGHGLGAWIRTHAPAVAVLLTSGHHDARDATGAPLLAKPYSRATLARAVRAALGVASRGASR